MTYTSQLIMVRAFLLFIHPHLPAKNMIKKFCSSKYYIDPTGRFLSLVTNVLHLEKCNAGRQRSLNSYLPQQIFSYQALQAMTKYSPSELSSRTLLKGQFSTDTAALSGSSTAITRVKISKVFLKSHKCELMYY